MAADFLCWSSVHKYTSFSQYCGAIMDFFLFLIQNGGFYKDDVIFQKCSTMNGKNKNCNGFAKDIYLKKKNKLIGLEAKKFKMAPKVKMAVIYLYKSLQML
jgi:DNA modification methylase